MCPRYVSTSPEQNNHVTYIKWDLINRCAGKEQSLFFNLLKAFDLFQSSHKSDIFYLKRPIFLHACATCSELTSNISNNRKQVQICNFFKTSYNIINSFAHRKHGFYISWLLISRCARMKKTRSFPEKNLI